MNSQIRCILVLCMVTLFSVFSTLHVFAQTDTSSLNPDISSLETRFFDHAYPHESTADRLDRLERMVFGETKTGSDQARLTALLVAVPEDPAKQTASNSAAASSPPTTTSAPSTASGPSEATDSDQYQTASVPTAPGTVAASSDYPRITQLEQEILGKTFVNEPIQQRLEQLEVKAFGRASQNTDLSDRTDALETYADQHFPHQQPNYNDTAYGGYPTTAPAYNPASSYNAAPAYTPNPTSLSPNATLDQKVAWLEKQVFNKTDPSLPLLDRVKKLAVNIFPADSPQQTQSIADQVNSMIGAVELNPRQSAPTEMAQSTPPPFSGAPDYNQTQYTPSAYNQYAQYNQPNYSAPQNQIASQPPVQKTHSHSFVSGLAHVLGTVGTMAAGSMMGGGMGMMGGGGYGMPFGL